MCLSACMASSHRTCKPGNIPTATALRRASAEAHSGMPRTRSRCMGESGIASNGSPPLPLGPAAAWLASRCRLLPSSVGLPGDAGRLLAPNKSPAAAAAASAAAGEANSLLDAMAARLWVLVACKPAALTRRLKYAGLHGAEHSGLDSAAQTATQ